MSRNLHRKIAFVYYGSSCFMCVNIYVRYGCRSHMFMHARVCVCMDVCRVYVSMCGVMKISVYLYLRARVHIHVRVCSYVTVYTEIKYN